MTISSMKLKKKLISQAIDVLRETKNRDEESGKKALFEDDSRTLFLQVMLKKIPKRNGSQMIKVKLPHSLLKDTDEVCLITGDTNKSYRKAETEPDVLLYKALLDKHGVTQVSKVVTLRQLRTDYKPYADKQKLLAAYDVFLADDKIYECLPRVLGKFFYKKRKFPLQINMKSPNLKQQIEKALSIRRFYVTGNGNSCCSEVAYLDMSNSEILANVTETINTVSKEMPGAWDNIMGIYLKTARSKAIPIYVSYGNPNDVVLSDEESEDEIIMDDLSTKPNVSVKVHKDGNVELFSSKRGQETCFDEVKSDSPGKNKKRESQKSEMKGNNVAFEEITHTDSTKKSKKEKKNAFEDSLKTPLLTGSDVAVKEITHTDSTKKSKKEKKKVFKDSLKTPLLTDTDVAFKEIKHIDSTKKPKKEKKTVSKDSLKTPLLTEDLPEKKKTALKRKREQNGCGSEEKEPFCYESPKIDTKKRKVDSNNLGKKQHIKNARKKTLRQKAKKNFKA